MSLYILGALVVGLKRPLVTPRCPGTLLTSVVLPSNGHFHLHPLLSTSVLNILGQKRLPKPPNQAQLCKDVINREEGLRCSLQRI